MKTGQSGTERHRDHVGDHDRDHVTMNFHGHVQSARALLEAVAAGDERSTELAEALVEGVLGDELVQAATRLRELLRTRSPFALVRAVELAEALGADDSQALAARRRP